MNIIKQFGWVIALVIAIIALFTPAAKTINNVATNTLRGMTNYDGLTIIPVESTDAFKVGSNGSSNVELKAGTCTLTNYSTSGQGIDASHAASTTKVYQCPVTGVTSGDITFTQLGTSTAMTANGWQIVGSTASSTDGYINVLISNETGSAKVPSSVGVGSTTNYWYVDTL